ncbi:MAG: mechanosensitive ion channel [Dechloromonas sp.]|nr:mechanosensitive ion channel [Dechloromonas sp.]
MSRALIIILAATLAFVPGVVSAETSTNATHLGTGVASTTVADTVKQAIASEDLHRGALARLEQAGQWRGLGERVAALEEKFDALSAGAVNRPDLINSIELDRHLRGLHREAETLVEHLAGIVRRLEHDGKLLEASVGNWRERAQFLESQGVPPAVLERTRSIKVKLEHANARIREFRDSMLLVLNRALVLQAGLDDARALIVARRERIDALRASLEQAPIWRLGAPSAEFEHVGAQLNATWQMQWDYLVQDGARLGGLFLSILVLTIWLFTRRPGLLVAPVQRAYGRPFAAALLIALVLLWWLAPSPPRLFYEVLLLLVPIPAAMVARRATSVAIPLTLYGIALSTMLLSLRGLVDASPLANRILLMLQVICVVIPIAIDLRHGRLQRAFRWPGPAIVRVAALLMMAVAGVTAFQVVFGFTGPATSVRAGMGSVLGSILVFGTAALVLYGAVRALLATPLAQWLNSAREPDPALLRVLRLILAAFAIGSVGMVGMGSLGLVPAVQSAIGSLMGTTLEVGTVSITFKSVATALAVFFATVVLTGVVGFVLDREIVPRLNLQPGAGYAVVKLTRWSMFIVGAALALAALGIEMTQITLIAGALSVGIGFGLQNVINNFVSGLILIVERPIGVGDVIEWGSKSGTITRIGIRSSTVRTGQGAEILVPNGDLLAKEVVNWTRSDRQRRYDIDVDVALGSEPERVMGLLAEAAGEVPEIMKTPPPRVVFKGIGDTSLNFTLLAWVASVEQGFLAQNALRVAMLKKLEGAGIAPFSQRDLAIRSVDDREPKMPG